MRTHLITGAGSGIGEALATLLLQRGDRVVAVARTDERAEELKQRHGFTEVLVGDLADPTRLAEAVQGWTLPDRLDSVVHVAGVVGLSRVADQNLAELQHQLDVNLVSPFVVTRAGLPALRAARGTCVFVNSTAGLTANPEWSAYAASKWGLRALADSLRQEEADHGVRVTTVFPGRTATPMQELVHQQEGKVYDASAWPSAATVAASIVHVLDLPPGTTINNVTLSPAPRG